MKTIILVALFTIAYVIGMNFVNNAMKDMQYDKIETDKEVVSSSNIYTVSISGSVVKPGKYTVTKDSTLGYLISIAGGLNDTADISAFNSNATLVNEGAYYIPYKRVDENNNSIKISINSANQAALDTLPGIGEVFAKRIIEYRIANGPFNTIEELMNVNGIGESLYESLKDLVCL